MTSLQSSSPPQSGSPQQGVCHVLKWVCQPQSPCDLWLLWFPSPVWWLQLLTFPRVSGLHQHAPFPLSLPGPLQPYCPQCHRVPTSLTSASVCCPHESSNRLWSRAEKCLQTSLGSHSRFKDPCHERLSFLNLKVKMTFSRGFQPWLGKHVHPGPSPRYSDSVHLMCSLGI